MVRDSRRRFLRGAGAIAAAGLAGCTGNGDGGDGDAGGNGGDGGDGGGGDGGQAGTPDEPAGSDVTPLEILIPEGTIHYPLYEAALEEGIFEEEGIDLEVSYVPFDAQAQSVTNGEVETSNLPFIPSVNNQLRGEDLVTFGFEAALQSVNALYVRADSEYESIQDLEGQRIGVWSWGSSTVQAFQAVVAEQTGLNLQQDFETTTAAPPALVGLLDDGEIDGVINVSGLTITMESQPDNYRSLAQLNELWIEETGHTLPLTSWWAYEDWYDENTDLAAALLTAARNATEYWQENTREILEEYGEPAAVDDDAKIDVVEEWAQEGQVFLAEADDDYIDATWQFVELMADYEFMDGVPDRDEVLRNPL